ncbi:hypothetical protein [Pseudomonas peli]|uniref:hypothetical protein n=1 Tax=Pseudomonas peli TaxID=592361 RepID=UPI003D15C975
MKIILEQDCRLAQRLQHPGVMAECRVSLEPAEQSREAAEKVRSFDQLIAPFA